MVNMGNNRHVPDVVLSVHNGPDLKVTKGSSMAISFPQSQQRTNVFTSL